MRMDDALRALVKLRDDLHRRLAKGDTLEAGEYLKGMIAGVNAARLRIMEMIAADRQRISHTAPKVEGQ